MTTPLNETPPTRGNPEGLPIFFYCWKTEAGRSMVRLTGRGLRENGKPLKTGLMLDVTDVSPERLHEVLGSALIPLIYWTCRESPLAGDLSITEAAYDSSVLRAYDLTETGEYPQANLTAR